MLLKAIVVVLAYSVFCAVEIISVDCIIGYKRSGTHKAFLIHDILMLLFGAGLLAILLVVESWV